MKKIMLIMLFILSIGFLQSTENNFNWQLPVELNATRFEVYEAIGIPEGIMTYDTIVEYFVRNDLDPEDIDFDKNRSIEYYNSIGLSLVFIDDILTFITIQVLGDEGTHKDFKGYIINDLLLTDTRQEIIKKLGTPDLMKTDPLPHGNDNKNGVAFPSLSYYTWNYKNYYIEIDITNEIQSVSESYKIPKDRISNITLTTIKNE